MSGYPGTLAGSGCATCVANGGRRGVCFQSPVVEDATKSRPSGWGSEESRLPRNLRCHSLGRASTGDGTQTVITLRAVGIPFPTVLKGGEKGGLASTPEQMTTSLQAHRLAAGIKNKQSTMQQFRARGAASQNMDGTAMDAPIEHVGWKPVTVARRYAGVTASEDAAGVKCSREIASIKAGVLLVSGQCAPSNTAFPQGNRRRIHQRPRLKLRYSKDNNESTARI